jgi:hypothetical protein
MGLKEVVSMISRDELMRVLRQRLPKNSAQEIEEIAHAVLALEPGWEEVQVPHSDLGYSVSENCSEICWLASEVARGAQIRLFRRK